MKSTKLSVLLLISLGTALGGFFLPAMLVGRGFQVPVSPANLLITLTAIAVVLLLLAIPIWRYRSALNKNSTQRPKRVDPFYAVRVLLLAKASSIAGALFVGWHLGVVIFQLSGVVVVQALIAQSFFGFLASLTLVLAAIITEQICRLPKNSEPDADLGVRS